jgi:hypothetical protein
MQENGVQKAMRGVGWLRDAWRRCGAPVAFAGALAVAALSTPPAGADLGPPAPLGPPFEPPLTVTSSFGEFRRNHFHGGVDFSTSQQTGRPVLAVGNGWVWRVRASGSGYGRAIYYRLSDVDTALTAVYAHLESFAPSIAAWVEAAQESLSRYEVDLYPPPGRLPFRLGEVIAMSGESGAGPPHLHFELRLGDEADVGVNPLFYRLQLARDVVDSLAPVITSVVLVPHGPGSRVDGSAAPRSYAPVGAAGGGLTLRAAPAITGDALVRVRAIDPAGNGNRLAPYSASLSVDGIQLYELLLARFDWERTHEVEMAYDFGRARRGDGFVMNLYRPIGVSDFPFGDWAPLRGLLSTRGDPLPFAAGRHAARIVVKDAAGNATTLAFDFVLESLPPAPFRPPAPKETAAGAAANRFRLGAKTRSGAVELTLFSGRPVTAAQDILLRTPVGAQLVTFPATGTGQSVAEVALPEGLYSPVVASLPAGAAGAPPVDIGTLDIAVVTRGPEATFRHGRLTIEAPERAFFGPGAILFSESDAGPSPGLTPVGPAVILETGDMVLDRAVTVRLAPPAPMLNPVPGKLALYRLTDNGTWDWLGNTPKDGGLEGTTRYLTGFGLFIDVSPPTIGTTRPAPGAATGPRPELFAGLRDIGSGFGWREIETTIDGVPQIVVYDPEAGTLRGRSRRELSKGAHTWNITLRDRAGNVTTRDIPFRVR